MNGATAYILACKHNNVKIAEKIAQWKETDLTIKDKYGRTGNDYQILSQLQDSQSNDESQSSSSWH